MRSLTHLLPPSVATLISGLLGVLLGHLSHEVYVIGLVPIALGLVAAGLVSLVSLVVANVAVGTRMFSASVAVIIGWGAFQSGQDKAFVEHWRLDYAAAKQASAGVEPSETIGADEALFYVQGADEVLEREVLRVTGERGFVGRWLFRADAGVRLLGPANGGRGLALGRVGAILWACLEILLALWVARRLLLRVERLLDLERPSEEDVQ